MKAEYIGKCNHKYDDLVDLFYKYHDHEYMITDEHNGFSESIQSKHQYEQNRIDRILNSNCNSSENAQTGLDFFFDSFE